VGQVVNLRADWQSAHFTRIFPTIRRNSNGGRPLRLPRTLSPRLPVTANTRTQPPLRRVSSPVNHSKWGRLLTCGPIGNRPFSHFTRIFRAIFTPVA
jgi:hypothetical protein